MQLLEIFNDQNKIYKLLPNYFVRKEEWLTMKR
jgi:hypothetical protein